MIQLVIEWSTISSLATGVGTLVLAVATFSAVRSSNRSARIAEVALQEQRRPVLAPSRLEDPKQKIMFLEGNWVSATGSHGVADHTDGMVYLAISLRNVGSGIAVCQGWSVMAGTASSLNVPTHFPLEQFRLQSRDLYVPAGDIGMWQGALRNPDDRVRAEVVEAIETGQPITVELLYSDQVGRQRTISRFGLFPAGDTWLASLSRHWYLDWDGPRPESLALAATEAILRDHEAASERRTTSEGGTPATDVGRDPGDGRRRADGSLGRIRPQPDGARSEPLLVRDPTASCSAGTQPPAPGRHRPTYRRTVRQQRQPMGISTVSPPTTVSVIIRMRSSSRSLSTGGMVISEL